MAAKNKLLAMIGNNIRQLRIDAGYSQESFGEHCDIERSYMGRIERGEQNISMTVFVRLCLGLRCNPECIIPGFFTLKKYKQCTLNSHNRSNKD